MNEKNTRTLRETSPPSKVNIIELNRNEESVNDKTYTLSISDSLIEEMKMKYQAVVFAGDDKEEIKKTIKSLVLQKIPTIYIVLV